MEISRVAIVFDDTSRPETTGVYCRRALEQMVHRGEISAVEHFLPRDLGRIRRDEFDLFLNIDDGLRYPWPDQLRPCACWVIDTHLAFTWSLEKSRSFDFVFAAQRDGSEQLRHAGVSSAVWLPLACDPELHGRQEVAKEFDVAFVGNLFPGPREVLLRLIQREFPQCFIGQRYFQEMARIYSSARCVFNRSLRDDVNMRVFEGLASGSLLITNDLSHNGQAELFQDGRHMVTYASGEELLDKLRFYVRHERLREQIAQAGSEEVVAHHTYRHRMQALLQSISTRSSAIDFQKNPPEQRQEHSYFDFSRPEVLELVPESAVDILELGCASGRLGESIKRRQVAVVIGVELDPLVAAEAATRLDRVIVGDLETLSLDFEPESLDCVICADVLEHLSFPENILWKARRWLRPDGTLVASLPNVRHHSVIRGLMQGNWTYEPAGLLDRTHVRFFTRRDLQALFIKCGFRIQEVRAVSFGDDGERLRTASNSPNVDLGGGLCLESVPPQEAGEFFAYQYLVIAHPEPQFSAVENTDQRCAPVMMETVTTGDLPAPDSELRVRIVRNYDFPDLMRQSPHGSGRWGEISFTEDPIEDPDYLIVLNEFPGNRIPEIKPRTTWSIAQEPPEEYFAQYQRSDPTYARRYIQDPAYATEQTILAPGALPWHVNRTYDELKGLAVPSKSRDLSCVISSKSFLPGQRERLKFLEAIQGSIPCDLFGRGFTELVDKFDGLAPYRYSLALENHTGPYYWTEKIADCFLTWTMPIYSGCTRITEFFPPEALLVVDVRDPEGSIAQIQSAIRERRFERNLAAIAHARDLVLHKYQLFAFLAEEIRADLAHRQSSRIPEGVAQ